MWAFLRRAIWALVNGDEPRIRVVVYIHWRRGVTYSNADLQGWLMGVDGRLSRRETTMQPLSTWLASGERTIRTTMFPHSVACFAGTLGDGNHTYELSRCGRDNLLGDEARADTLFVIGCRPGAVPYLGSILSAHDDAAFVSLSPYRGELDAGAPVEVHPHGAACWPRRGSVCWCGKRVASLKRQRASAPTCIESTDGWAFVTLPSKRARH